MITVWGRRNSSNVMKVMWAVDEIGLEHVRHDVGGTFGGVDTDDYKAKNPNGLVPVIEDGDTAVWESHAIIRYLASRYDAGGLWPEDPAIRAHADQWMDWLHTLLGPRFFPVFFATARSPAAEQDRDKINSLANTLGETMGLLDKHLGGRNFIAGETLTMGDIPLGSICYRYYQLDIPRPGLPNIEAWYARLQERPAYQKHVMFPFGNNLEEFAKLEREGAVSA